MSPFELATLFLGAVAVGAWLNARTARLPHGVAMLLVGVAGAGAILGLKGLRPDLAAGPIAALAHADFAEPCSAKYWASCCSPARCRWTSRNSVAGGFPSGASPPFGTPVLIGLLIDASRQGWRKARARSAARRSL